VSCYIHERLSRFFQHVVVHPRRGPRLSIVLLLLTAWSVYATDGPRLLVAVLAIVTSHEMGHYVACRCHGVDSTWPFLLPASPLLNPIAGTFGAVMVIRSPFPNRRALFDIGVAGPLAGMAVCLPVLWLGMHESAFVPAARAAEGIPLGSSLGILLAERFAPPTTPPAGMEAVLGPFGAAAWFGLLLTGLNLIPLGQLDGGHILYALFPRQALRISRAIWWLSLGLIWFAPSWILWAAVMRLLARRHPATLDDASPLGWRRTFVAIVALLVFVLCFIPVPVPGAWSDVLTWLRSLQT
jgi:membrane-associated protease RseP (regulator of RpoE activity)